MNFPSLQRKHIYGFLSYAGTRAGTMLIFLFTIPFFINRSGEVEYGKISLALSLLAVTNIIDSGMTFLVAQILGRYAARNDGAKSERSFNQLMRTALLLGFSLSVVVWVCIAIAHAFSPIELVYWLVPLCFMPICLSNVIGISFQAHHRVDILNFSRFSMEIAKALTLIISCVIFDGAKYFGAILLVFLCIRLLIDTYMLRRILHYSIHWGTGLYHFSKRRLNLALPAFAFVGLVQLLTLGDRFLVNHFFNTDGVTVYSLAIDLNTKAHFIVNGIITALFSSLVHAKATKNDPAKYLRVAYMGIGLVIVIYYIPLFLFSKQIVTLWINADLATRVTPMIRVTVLATICHLIGGIYENRHLANGQPRKVFKTYLITVALYYLSVFIVPNDLGIIKFAYCYLILNVTYLIAITRNVDTKYAVKQIEVPDNG